MRIECGVVVLCVQVDVVSGSPSICRNTHHAGIEAPSAVTKTCGTSRIILWLEVSIQVGYIWH